MRAQPTTYSTPVLRDIGDVRSLTAADSGGGLHFNQAAIGSVAGPPVGTQTTSPDQEVQDNFSNGGTQTPGGSVPDGNDVADQTSSGGGNPSNGGGGPTVASELGSGGGGAAELPFTGLEVGPVALLGAGLASAGVALRRIARRP